MVDLKRVYRPNIQGCCGAGPGRTGSPLGQSLSDCNQVLANRVGELVSLFQIPSGNSPGDIHHQLHQSSSSPVPEIDQNQERLPERGQSVETALSRGSNCQQEVDDAYPELEHYPVPIGHLL